MKNKKIAIVGMGYVGLPLAVEFGKKRDVIGFDINKTRIDELKSGYDATLEISQSELKNPLKITFTTKAEDLRVCEIFIIAVPTPIDKDKNPDLIPLKNASRTVGLLLKENDIVIYESTVYPGATEEVCVPILEKFSKLKFNSDFFCGYSPERINPGDKDHRISNIKKITSGSTEMISQEIDDLYNEIIIAGTHKAASIKVAEAAKVIENTQRDVNIALINELSVIFNRLDIDTEAVLLAAGTKWNFLPFRPGLVGGHCIGVDPYYLTYKALQVGYNPEMILAGRKLNDNMGSYIVGEVSRLMSLKSINLFDSNILIMGFAFKENCPDHRNTRVLDLLDEFTRLNCNVDIYDPWVNKEDTFNEYNIMPIDKPALGKYDAIVMAVAHDEFKKFSIENIREFGKEKHLIYDVKYVYRIDQVDGRL